MVTNQAVFTIMHCAANAWKFQLRDSSDVINGAVVVSESQFFFLPLSSLYSALC